MREIEVLSREENLRFVIENSDKDPAKLVLSSKNPEIKILAEQILARQKAIKKLPSWFSTKGIFFPSSLSVEQASSETAALYKSELFSGRAFADLTGGLGVDSLAFARRFKSGFYVEKNEKKAAFAAHNFSVFGQKNLEVRSGDCAEWLCDFSENALDLIYIDPARRDSSGKKTSLFEDCEPDVLSLLSLFFAKSERVLIKASPMLDIKAAVEQLGNVKSVHVLALENECKELLFECQKNFIGEAQIFCVNIKNSEKDVFQSTYAQEAVTQVNFSAPRKYIYEPNAALLKGGFFKKTADFFSLHKLAPDTHLYTSDVLCENFQGKTFSLRSVISPDKKKLSELLPEGKANFISRNYPLSAADLAKKLKFEFGGDKFVIAATWLKDKSYSGENSLTKNLLVVEKVG